jgi:hypothetical protein
MTGPYETAARRSRPVSRGASTAEGCPQELGKTAPKDGRTAMVQGMLPACLLGRQHAETGEGSIPPAPGRAVARAAQGENAMSTVLELFQHR